MFKQPLSNKKIVSGIFNDSGEIVGEVAMGSANFAIYENQVRNLIINNYPSQTQLGDLNEDVTINIQDIILVIGNILGNIDLNNEQFNAGDINNDNIIDILDIVQIVDKILNPDSAGWDFATNWTGEDSYIFIHFQTYPNILNLFKHL